MASIIYVGMDIHTTNFTFCCYTADSDRGFAVAQTEPDYRQVIKYMERVQKQRGEECKFVCGYEAGCLGYSLYHQLTRCGVDCVILAPSTMHQEKGKRIKTDRRDAENIARCLAFSLYSPVYVPTTEDDAVKEYIRMRDDIKADLKRVKQLPSSFSHLLPLRSSAHCCSPLFPHCLCSFPRCCCKKEPHGIFVPCGSARRKSPAEAGLFLIWMVKKKY